MEMGETIFTEKNKYVRIELNRKNEYISEGAENVQRTIKNTVLPDLQVGI